MRLFLALAAQEINPDLKKLRVGLDKGKNFDHRWIPMEHRHVTLCEFVDMGQEKMQELHSLISESLSTFTSVDLKFEGLFAYPTVAEGRLIWIGVQHSRELKELQSKLEDDLQKFVVPREAEKPYLAVVRLKNHRELSDLISPYRKTEFGKFNLHCLRLFEMSSGGPFPTYRVVKEYGQNAPSTF